MGNEQPVTPAIEYFSDILKGGQLTTSIIMGLNRSDTKSIFLTTPEAINTICYRNPCLLITFSSQHDSTAVWDKSSLGCVGKGPVQEGGGEGGGGVMTAFSPQPLLFPSH